jgi:hypothetical protein
MTDRRLQRRYPGASLRLLQSTLRPGCDVEVLDLSESGAQIRTDRPLGPGLRVHVRLVTSERTIALAAHVLRCAVCDVHPDRGVRYRGALAFEGPCLPLWEDGSPGCMPQAEAPDAGYGAGGCVLTPSVELETLLRNFSLVE